MGILLRKYTKNTSGDLVVDGSFVVLANNVDAEFLNKTRLKQNKMGKLGGIPRYRHFLVQKGRTRRLRD